MPLAGEQVEYPVELWDQDVEGAVLIRVLVGVEGRADSVEVARSSGHEALDSAAASGARAMNFEPARRSADGAAQRAWISLPVTFSKTPPDSARSPEAPSSGAADPPDARPPDDNANPGAAS